jgi:hypothetical protein
MPESLHDQPLLGLMHVVVGRHVGVGRICELVYPGCGMSWRWPAISERGLRLTGAWLGRPRPEVEGHLEKPCTNSQMRPLASVLSERQLVIGTLPGWFRF